VKRLSAVVLAALLLVAGCSGSSGKSAKPSDLNPGAQGTGTFQGAGLTPAQPRPAFTLTDTAGKTFSFAQVTAKHPTLLYFGYTNCPDVCPTTMSDIAQALKALPKSVSSQTYVVFVTTDVKHDTAPVISQWLGSFSGLADGAGHWVGLRGTQSQIDLAQAAAHITLASDDGQTHSAEALLYGPDNYAHVVFLQSNTLQQQVQHDLPLVAKGVTT
jgi:protein SCO1